MFLGQLYYYEAELGKVGKPLSLESLCQIDIAGLGKINYEKYAHLSNITWQQEVKIEFINYFTQLLEDEGLDQAAAWWKNLTSPLHTTKETYRNSFRSEFTRSLNAWIQQGMPPENLKELILIGQLSTNTADRVICYGMQVLMLLVQVPEGDEKIQNWTLPDASNKQIADLNPDYDILVYGPIHLAPLLEHINALYISPNQEPVFKHISKFLTSYPSINLVLVDHENTEPVTLLSKAFPDKLIIPFSFESSSGSYFDQIAKKTLGIRLPS